MSARSEYEDFLINGLSELVLMQDDHEERAHIALTSIIAGGNAICESMFSLYTAKVDIDKEVLLNLASKLIGMGVLIIICDCEEGRTERCLKNSLVNGLDHALGLSLKNSKIKKELIEEIARLTLSLEI